MPRDLAFFLPSKTSQRLTVQIPVVDVNVICRATCHCAARPCCAAAQLTRHTHALSCLRVSTTEQGKSGLGLEAQRKAVADHLNSGSWELVGEYTEVESDKRHDRPELERAIAACKKHRARLIVAKLDWLSRNVAFVTALMERKVDAVDNPRRPHPRRDRRI